MESLVRLHVENQISYACDPRVDGDDLCRHLGSIQHNLTKADEEMVQLILRIIQEVTEALSDGDDSDRAFALAEMSIGMGLTLSEDCADLYDPKEPIYNPSLRPKLERPLDFILKILVDDLLFYLLFDVDPEYAREEWTRIGYHLRLEPPETIQAFVALTRKMADRITSQRGQKEKGLLLSMPYELGLLPDPR